jgi:hypothetical protein
MSAWNSRILSALLASAALLGGGVTMRAQDASQQPEDAVAAAARRSREQKKKDDAKPKKVYTDDDLSKMKGGVTSASAEVPKMPGQAEAAKTEGGDQAVGADAAGAEKPKETPEQRWRKRFADAYKDLDRSERELDILQRENDKAQVQYYSDPTKALKEQYTRKEINERDAKIAAKQKEVQQAKDRISDLEDQLRKDGGDPGWAARP